MGKRIVIALGGNALGNNLPEQMAAVKHTAKAIVDLIQEGHQVVVAHGNGPQVGRILLASETAHNVTPRMPFDVCGAMSQGYIGYDLQNGIRTELVKRGIYKPVATLLTQVTVNPYDDSSYTPVKKVGRIMSAVEAAAEEAKGNYVAEIPGKGFQRMVAAPKPVAIVEIDSIRALLDADQLVIACGGGGIPVMEQGQLLKGASAIIEKDLVSGLLAKEVDADLLMILTDVDCVSLNYGKPDQKPIREMTADEACSYLEEGQFGASNMAPKIQAAVDFIRAGKGRAAVITTQALAKDALAGKAGTIIR